MWPADAGYRHCSTPGGSATGPHRRRRRGWLCLIPLLASAHAPPAQAEMLLDKVIIDFKGGTLQRQDIEVTNTDAENMYVLVEPFEIVAPGTPGQSRVAKKDPRDLGLLVTPNRLVLEPGQSKLIRLSLLSRPAVRDRIYRLTVRPVVGEIVASRSALKIVVGYDVLVMARPPGATSSLEGRRDGRNLVLRNPGNSNVLILRARQCRKKDDCVELPTKRLYAHGSWSLSLPLDTPVELTVRSANGVSVRRY